MTNRPRVILVLIVAKQTPIINRLSFAVFVDSEILVLTRWKIGQAKRSISCRGGLTVQAVAALRSGSAGAWTVPPGGPALHPACPAIRGKGAKGANVLAFSYFSAALGTHDLACFVTNKNKPEGLFLLSNFNFFA